MRDGVGERESLAEGDRETERERVMDSITIIKLSPYSTRSPEILRCLDIGRSRLRVLLQPCRTPDVKFYRAAAMEIVFVKPETFPAATSICRVSLPQPRDLWDLQSLV